MIIPSDGVPGIQIQNTSDMKSKRATYDKLDEIKVTTHARKREIANAVVKYKSEFPSFTESTVRGSLKKYLSQLGANVRNSQIVVSAKRGRPLYLPDELDKRLSEYITHRQMENGTINGHMVFGVLMGLIIFFLSGFSFTDTDDSQGSRGREGTIFYSTLPLPPAHEHSDIYL